MTKGQKTVKTECEMETQDNDETFVDSKVDLLEQAVSEIKGESSEPKITSLFGSSKDNQDDDLVSLYTCKKCPDSYKCEKDHIMVQCKVCPTNGPLQRLKSVPNYKCERDLVGSNSYMINHFKEHHPEENVKFKMEITGLFRDALTRQADEAVRIKNCEKSELLNSKSQFNKINYKIFIKFKITN